MSQSQKFCAILFSLLLLAAIGWWCWVIWQHQASHAEMTAGQSAKLAELTSERDRLAGLLALDPCDAKARLKPGLTGHSALPSLPAAAAHAARKGAPSAANMENACVFIVSSDGRQRLSTGTGFFVTPEYVVTNMHVVAGGNGKALITNKSMDHPVAASVIAASDSGNADYALLKTDSAVKPAPQPLSFAKDVQKTQKVGAWGFPHLVGRSDPGYAKLLRGDIDAAPELSYSEGVVSAILPRNPALIIHTAPISPGNSGGPLVNEKGEVVGINTMIALDDKSFRQASVALSATDLLSFLAAHGINP